jgi:hypothetical protein
MREELKNLKTSDPKEYWKILNRGREKKQPDIPMEDLFNFFLKFKHGARFANSGGRTFKS